MRRFYLSLFNGFHMTIQREQYQTEDRRKRGLRHLEFIVDTETGRIIFNDNGTFVVSTDPKFYSPGLNEYEKGVRELEGVSPELFNRIYLRIKRTEEIEGILAKAGITITSLDRLLKNYQELDNMFLEYLCADEITKKFYRKIWRRRLKEECLW